MPHRPIAFGVLASLALVVALPANASVSLTASASTYIQDFDTLAASGTGNAWVNDATLRGWNLFDAANTAITRYSAGSGSSNTGSFYSFGSNADRALGGVGSGGAYFGAPASGTVAGYIAASFINGTGAALGGFAIGFDGEQWRNGGNTSAQTMVFSYGFGTSFADVAWTTPGGAFDFVSPVVGSAAAAVDGDTAGRVGGLGGTVDTNWGAGQTLWVRWTERNDVGNDHGLAIDNLSLRVASVAAVPEPGTYGLLIAGLGALALRARHRRRQAFRPQRFGKAALCDGCKNPGAAGLTFARGLRGADAGRPSSALRSPSCRQRPNTRSTPSGATPCCRRRRSTTSS